jgi:hypothetical protein
LRKAPILLKDGDWIGWGISSFFVGDDLQTDEDLNVLIILPSFESSNKKLYIVAMTKVALK